MDENSQVYIDDPWRELMRAIVRQAAEDARERLDLGAAWWLEDTVVQDLYSTVTGIDSRWMMKTAREAKEQYIRKVFKQLKRRMERERRHFERANRARTCAG